MGGALYLEIVTGFVEIDNCTFNSENLIDSQYTLAINTVNNLEILKTLIEDNAQSIHIGGLFF